MTVVISVHAKGPIFDRQNRSLPRKTIEQLVKRVVEDADQRLAETLRPRPAGVYLSIAEAGRGKASTGNYRRRISTRSSGLRGRIFDGGVEYGPWLEGTSTRNQTTRFKGYHSFRKTTQWMNRVRVPQLLQKIFGSMTNKLNGI
jgi:hypothetical protein